MEGVAVGAVYGQCAVGEDCGEEFVAVEFFLVIGEEFVKVGIEVIFEVLHILVCHLAVEYGFVAVSVVEADVVETESIGVEVDGVSFDVVWHIGGSQAQIEVWDCFADDVDVVEGADDADGACDVAVDFFEYASEEAVEEGGVCVVCVDVESDVVFGW